MAVLWIFLTATKRMIIIGSDTREIMPTLNALEKVRITRMRLVDSKIWQHKY